MKHTAFIMPLYTPDIMEYIAGREAVCQLVLLQCKQKSSSCNDAITVKTQLFKELLFSVGDVIELILAAGKELKIKFSYNLILQMDNYSTVEDLATLLWKYMCRVVRFN
jgi:acyl carrier protein